MAVMYIPRDNTFEQMFMQSINQLGQGLGQNANRQQTGQQLSELAKSLGMQLPAGMNYGNPAAQQVLSQMISNQQARQLNPMSTDELYAKLVSDKLSGKGTDKTSEAMDELLEKKQYRRALKPMMYDKDGEMYWGLFDQYTGEYVKDLRKALPKELTSASMETVGERKELLKGQIEQQPLQKKVLEGKVEAIPFDIEKKKLDNERIGLTNQYKKETDPLKKELLGKQLEEKGVRIEQLKSQIERTNLIIEKLKGSDEYKADIKRAIEAMGVNEDPFNIARQLSGKYPDKSAEINRIFLSEEPKTALEAMMRQGMKENTPSRPKTFTVPETKYKVGQIIKKGGKILKVVSFDTDGEPLVEEVK